MLQNISYLLTLNFFLISPNRKIMTIKTIKTIILLQINKMVFEREGLLGSVQEVFTELDYLRLTHFFNEGNCYRPKLLNKIDDSTTNQRIEHKSLLLPENHKLNYEVSFQSFLAANALNEHLIFAHIDQKNVFTRQIELVWLIDITDFIYIYFNKWIMQGWKQLFESKRKIFNSKYSGGKAVSD